MDAVTVTRTDSPPEESAARTGKHDWGSSSNVLHSHGLMVGMFNLHGRRHICLHWSGFRGQWRHHILGVLHTWSVWDTEDNTYCVFCAFLRPVSLGGSPDSGGAIGQVLHGCKGAGAAKSG